MNIKITRKVWISAGITLALVILALLVSTAMAQEPDDGSPLAPSGGFSPANAFTYQGRLLDGGQPVNGTYDFVATIWDSGGLLANQVTTCLTDTTESIPVEDGIFTLYLAPYGPMNRLFNGEERWIEIAVSPAGANTYTVLGRQPIAPTPYAWSLRPGAVISGTAESADFGGAIVNIKNDGTSHYALNVQSNSGSAVYGYAGSTDGIGVIGLQTGYSVSDLGGYWEPGGFFGGDNGVFGVSKEANGYGVAGLNRATTGAAYGVFGKTDSPSGWAGYFYTTAGNGVYISAPSGKDGLNVAGGTKNAVVRTDEGSKLLYTEESTEVWFTDYGFGQLEDGAAVITIDEVFAQTVNLEEPYHVFVQVYGDAEIYVSNRTPTQFEIHLRDGDPDVEFSYRIVAKRLGYEDDRLGPAPWADDDPNLYPEKQDALDAQGGWDQPLGGSE